MSGVIFASTVRDDISYRIFTTLRVRSHSRRRSDGCRDAM